MNMLEFVTVKDNLLKVLKSYPAAIDSEVIFHHAKFSSQPNGVVEACIGEMDQDKSIIVMKKETVLTLNITESGRKVLAEGGYVKKYFDKQKMKERLYSSPLKTDSTQTNRLKVKKQTSLVSDTIGVLSLLLLLFKRI